MDPAAESLEALLWWRNVLLICAIILIVEAGVLTFLTSRWRRPWYERFLALAPGAVFVLGGIRRWRSTGAEHDQPDELRHDEGGCRADDLRQVERAAQDDDTEDAQRERDLVRDELRARAHRAEDRELRLRGPAADDEAVDADRAEREDRTGRTDVRDLTVDVPTVHRPAGPKRDEGEGGDRGEGRDDRREDVRQVDRRLRGERLLADELEEVGDRLEEPELAGAVRSVTELHPPHQLPLDQRQVREEPEEDVDDDHRLDQRDPPGLFHALTTSSAFATSTMPASPSACSSGTRAMPARRWRLMRAESVIALPLEPTVTRSPVAILRRRASSAESSSSGCGGWN